MGAAGEVDGEQEKPTLKWPNMSRLKFLCRCLWIVPKVLEPSEYHSDKWYGSFEDVLQRLKHVNRNVLRFLLEESKRCAADELDRIRAIEQKSISMSGFNTVIVALMASLFSLLVKSQSVATPITDIGLLLVFFSTLYFMRALFLSISALEKGDFAIFGVEEILNNTKMLVIADAKREVIAHYIVNTTKNFDDTNRRAEKLHASQHAIKRAVVLLVFFICWSLFIYSYHQVF